ncbi:hypothetical protein CBR_g37669 [Chara braunii]|uniref:DDE Tnp4 domain-containing protein n=1 Tax=Chara braunii TaxID=69332 RepID=A0A388LNM6_CHABU|nr:hypothetical protein CBR_g37669 [Chara braunii]|eukprot:GBG83871.1 hypothetical protein CBR_g37669 [Chara braunii]
MAVGVLLRAAPRWWVKPRAGGAWRYMTWGDNAHADYFHDNIRMGEDVFRGIVANVRPHLHCSLWTRYRAPTPPEQLVAYALYRWASGESFEHSATSFKLGRETGRVAVQDVAAAIVRAYPDEVSFPTGHRLVDAMEKFQAKGFPRCYGAIDCTHVYIDKPAGRMAAPYCDRHKRFTVVAQVVTGSDLMVYDVVVGWPGSVHDSRVLHHSSLFRRADSRALFRADPLVLPGGVTTRGYLLGDNGYPSLPWLVTPYGGQQVPGTDHDLFDSQQKAARGCVERAFGRLKCMWRMFLRTHKPNIRLLLLQFHAVCVIPNLLIRVGVEMDPELEERPEEDEDVLWEGVDPVPPPTEELTVRGARVAGQRFRDALRPVVAQFVRAERARARERRERV